MIQFNAPGRRPVPVDPTDDEVRAVVLGGAALTRLASQGEPDNWPEIRGLITAVDGELVELGALTAVDLIAAREFLRQEMATALAGMEKLARRLSAEELSSLGELFDGPDAPDAA